MTTHKDATADVRYLLGQLPEEEHARLERALLEDEEAFQRMLALEDELFHDYAQDGLDPEQRRRFEERYLASETGRRRLADARALLAGLPRERRPRGTLSWLLPIAAALVLAAGGYWFLSFEPRGPAPAAARVALALTPGLVRDVSAGPRRATLGPDEVLVLTLALPSGAPTQLQARVVSAEGREVWRKSALAVASAGSLVLEVPAGVLPRGDYQLLLLGPVGAAEGHEIADYAFTILRP